MQTTAGAESRDVWVFAQLTADGAVHPVTRQLLGVGATLARQLGQRLCAVLAGTRRAAAQELFACGAEVVYFQNDPLLDAYTTDGYAAALCELIERHCPEIVLFGATHLGRDLAPRVAARVGTGLTADCTGLEIDPETKNLRQTRPAFGGNLMATILCPGHRPQMATVRPGVMQEALPQPGRRGAVVEAKSALTAALIRTTILSTLHEGAQQAPLSEARVIVSGGLGLGGPEGFLLLRELATLLGGTVGASRAAVDAGWADAALQVGQTGTTVRPAVYIACGISGAIQHLAGMQNSKCILAINKNRDAPIFSVADHGFVGDYRDILPPLLAALRG